MIALPAWVWVIVLVTTCVSTTVWPDSTNVCTTVVTVGTKIVVVMTEAGSV